jgi:hypothetical protein
MSGRSQSLYLYTIRAVKCIEVIIGAYLLCQVRTKLYQTSCFQVNSRCRENYWGSLMWISKQQFNCWSYILHLSNIFKKWVYNDLAHQLFIYFKNASDSVRRKVVYNILKEPGIPMNLVRLLKYVLMKLIQDPDRQEFVWYVSY